MSGPEVRFWGSEWRSQRREQARLKFSWKRLPLCLHGSRTSRLRVSGCKHRVRLDLYLFRFRLCRVKRGLWGSRWRSQRREQTRVRLL